MASFTLFSGSTTARTLLANEDGIVGLGATLATTGAVAISATNAQIAILGAVVSSGNFGVFATNDVDLVVGPQGSLTSTTSAAVSSALTHGDLVSISNAGTISGNQDGIAWSTSSTNADNPSPISFEIGNIGTIQGLSDGITAYAVIGTSIITNSGVIHGKFDGIRISESSVADSPTIRLLNSGEILGGGGGYDGVRGIDEITNTGTIATQRGQRAIDTFDGEDVVHNAGTVVGDIYLGLGNDTFKGRKGLVDGTMFGQAGDDTLISGDSDDILLGGTENDSLLGGAGNDTLNGEAGDDTVRGGSGDDEVLGGGGVDRVRGGDGNDFVSGEGRGDVIIGDAGNDTLLGGGGNDILRAGADDDTLDGGEGNDELRAWTGDDSLQGDTGNDDLFGGKGEDTLGGGSGADLLSGGRGDDTLTGGADGDTFVFRAGWGHDSVTDFVKGEDVLDLTAFGYFSLADFQAEVADRRLPGGIEFQFDTGETLTVIGLTRNTLTADDFVF